MNKWNEYQHFSTKAKPYGGAHAYLDFLKNNAEEEGKDKGRAEGGAIVLITVAVGVTGALVFNKAKKHFNRRKQEKHEASIVRQEFLDNVQASDAQENVEAYKAELSPENEELSDAD
jgi:hypothetical protein